MNYATTHVNCCSRCLSHTFLCFLSFSPFSSFFNLFLALSLSFSLLLSVYISRSLPFVAKSTVTLQHAVHLHRYEFGDSRSGFERWCNADGLEGPGWRFVTRPGSLLSDLVDDNGIDATQACCACGGGTMVPVTTPPRPTTTPAIVQCVGKREAGSGAACSCRDKYVQPKQDSCETELLRGWVMRLTLCKTHALQLSAVPGLAAGT